MKVYGLLYRAFMRMAHRYNWHYAPVFGPFEDGSMQRWCQWCGFRQSFQKPKKFPLVVGVAAQKAKEKPAPVEEETWKASSNYGEDGSTINFHPVTQAKEKP